MNIPNLITVFRFLLVPFLIFVLNENQHELAALLVVIAAISDLLDGYWARKYHQVTHLGTVLDPLADKVMAISALTYFVIQGALPMAFLLAIFFRDISLLLGMLSLFVFHKKCVAPSIWAGKMSAAVTLCLIFFLCAIHRYPFLQSMIPVLYGLAAILVVLSFVAYSIRWFRLFETGNIK